MATQSSSSPAKKAKLGKWGVVGGLIAFVFALGFIGNLFTQGGAGSTESGVSGNIIPLLMLFALLIFSFVLKGWKRAVALIGIVAILLSPLLLKPSIKTVAQGYGWDAESRARALAQQAQQWQTLKTATCKPSWDSDGNQQGWCRLVEGSGVYRIISPRGSLAVRTVEGSGPIIQVPVPLGKPCSDWNNIGDNLEFYHQCRDANPPGGNYGQVIIRAPDARGVYLVDGPVEITTLVGVDVSLRHWGDVKGVLEDYTPDSHYTFTVQKKVQ